MFITKVPVSLVSPSALALVGDRQSAHVAVASSLPPLRSQDTSGGRTLWRILASPKSLDVVVVSPCQPDVGTLSRAFGSSESDAVSRPYTVESAVATDTVFRFDVETNPAHNVRGGKHKNTRRAAEGLTGKLNWLAAQGESKGFSLDRTPECESEIVKLRRPTGESSIVSARFRGFLRVTDPDTFRGALFNGIGRGKAFGFGLILLSQ